MIKVYKNHITGNYHAIKADEGGVLVFVWSPLTFGWLYTETNPDSVLSHCELVASNLIFK